MNEEPSEDDESNAVDPPTAERVVRRAMVLAAIGNRGLIENEAHKFKSPDEERVKTLRWLEDLDVTSELEPDEWETLQRPVGYLDRQTMINSVWRLEGLVVLL